MEKRRELETLGLYDVQFEPGDKSSAVVKDLLGYYVKNAIFYKRAYYALNIVAIVLNASIPIINQINWTGGKLTITIISSIAAVVVSLLALANVKDSWIRYRNYAEKLKSECNKVNTCIGIYNSSDVAKKKKRFFETIENLGMEDLELWKKSKDDNSDKSKQV